VKTPFIVLVSLMTGLVVPSCSKPSSPQSIIGTPTVITGPLLLGGTTIDDIYPNADLLYAKRSLADQLLITLNNPYSGSVASGSGFVCVSDTGHTGSVSVQNSNWPTGFDGTNPDECTLIGFGMPVAVLTQGDKDIYIRPNYREIAHFQNTGGVLKTGWNGVPPVARPIVTGSRSDGTALRSLLTALDSLGLVVDGTTP
jgi:hypothetical protein